jgi:hypothetical protein
VVGTTFLWAGLGDAAAAAYSQQQPPIPIIGFFPLSSVILQIPCRYFRLLFWFAGSFGLLWDLGYGSERERERERELLPVMYLKLLLKIHVWGYML